MLPRPDRPRRDFQVTFVNPANVYSPQTEAAARTWPISLDHQY
jgi:hypothetical protein